MVNHKQRKARRRRQIAREAAETAARGHDTAQEATEQQKPVSKTQLPSGYLGSSRFAAVAPANPAILVVQELAGQAVADGTSGALTQSCPDGIEAAFEEFKRKITEDIKFRYRDLRLLIKASDQTENVKAFGNRLEKARFKLRTDILKQMGNESVLLKRWVEVEAVNLQSVVETNFDEALKLVRAQFSAAMKGEMKELAAKYDARISQLERKLAAQEQLLEHRAREKTS